MKKQDLQTWKWIDKITLFNLIFIFLKYTSDYPVSISIKQEDMEALKILGEPDLGRCWQV